MKKIFTTISLVGFTVLFMTSCSEDKEYSVVGTWSWVSNTSSYTMTDADGNVMDSETEIETPEDGESWIITLNEDGTATSIQIEIDECSDYNDDSWGCDSATGDSGDCSWDNDDQECTGDYAEAVTEEASGTWSTDGGTITANLEGFEEQPTFDYVVSETTLTFSLDTSETNDEEDSEYYGWTLSTSFTIVFNRQ